MAALAEGRQVGIVVPLASQIDSESGKWAGLSRPPLYAVASPYAGNDAALTEAARTLGARGADLLVMDCMGFVEHHRKVAAGSADRPVILSNALIAKLTSEVL